MASSNRDEIRQAFQKRVKRFSAFEMLGIEGESSPSIEDSTNISDKGISEGDVSDRLMDGQAVPSEGRSDGLPVPHAIPSKVPTDPDISDPMIGGQSDNTSDHLIEGRIDTSSESSISSTASHAIPLAPLQWRVWQALVGTEGKVISLKRLAAQVSGSIPGVRQAIHVIEREGGVLSRETVREKTEEGAILQGFRIGLNHAISFQQITSKEAHRVQKRGLIHRHIADRLIHPPGDVSDGLRMYVCKENTYIRAENLAELLRISPTVWQIREQTLIQIADAFPTMTSLEFRLSLKRLIEQAHTGKQTIQNPNAWLKAAFEKNGGPLVTEREIEARFDKQGSDKLERQSTKPEEQEESHDLEMLRRYMAASPDERARIDEMAEKRAAPWLATVAEDKHAGILEQARIESTQEFFGS